MLVAGIIGLGVGERHIQGYLSDSRCRLKTICDKNSAKLNQVAEKYNQFELTTDPNQILNDPEINIVSIASYDNYHANQVVKAINSGKHVFVEKPLCLLQKELKQISKALNKNPEIKISSNLVLRQSPNFLDVKKSIDRNTFGNLYYIEGDYNYGRLNKIINGWRGDIPNYSVMHGGGIHLIDLISWFVDEPAIEVNAVGNKIVTEGTKFLYYDMITTLIKFKNNIIAKVTANFGSVTPHHHRLSVYGTNATFFQNHEVGTYYFKRGDENEKREINLTFDKLNKINVLKNFISSILDKKNPDISKKEVLDVMAISLAVEKSLVSNKWEKIKFVT